MKRGNVERTSSKFPWLPLSILLGIGGLAAVTAFLLVSHQADVPNWGVVIATLLVICFASWTWALILCLRWRDRGNFSTRPSAIDRDALNGTVYGLVPGADYQVIQSFTDFYQNQFRSGEVLRFKERHFLPYHGGHTIRFDQRSLYLQEDANAAILTNFAEYVARIDRGL